MRKYTSGYITETSLESQCACVTHGDLNLGLLCTLVQMLLGTSHVDAMATSIKVCAQLVELVVLKSSILLCVINKHSRNERLLAGGVCSTTYCLPHCSLVLVAGCLCLFDCTLPGTQQPCTDC